MVNSSVLPKIPNNYTTLPAQNSCKVYMVPSKKGTVMSVSVGMVLLGTDKPHYTCVVLIPINLERLCHVSMLKEKSGINNS